MKLILDDYKQVYVWADDYDLDHRLSPSFDYEEDAFQWAERMQQELNNMGNTQ
jgi:hypothetical protein